MLITPGKKSRIWWCLEQRTEKDTARLAEERLARPHNAPLQAGYCSVSSCAGSVESECGQRSVMVPIRKARRESSVSPPDSVPVVLTRPQKL